MKKLYRKLSLTSALLLMIASVALAQERVVTGTVTDEVGNTMPGVNVLLKGTSTGTASDADGKFSISVPNDNAVLVFTFVGYASSEEVVGARTNIELAMNPDVQTLTELVVTGYTTENRRDVTGAVSTVKPAQLTAVPSGNVEQQLQGRVAGVTVITNGQPGTTSVVRLRGFGAFGGNEPLYIVDGVPVTDTGFINPNDIETTTVLKDAPSASIYGSRAANGVIVYTTKRGKKNGNLAISYEGLVGVTVPGKVDNILNPQEQADWTWNAIRNTATQTGTTPVFQHEQYGTASTPTLPDYLIVGGQYGYRESVSGPLNLDAEALLYNTNPDKGAYYLVMKADKNGTNWWDELTRTAVTNRHSLGFSGGGDKSTFYVSFGFQDQEGILIHQKFKRYTMRINSDHEIVKGVRIGQSFQGSYIARIGLIGGNGGRGASNEETQVLSAFRMPAIIPVRDEFGGYAGTAAKGFNNPRNPVAERDRGSDDYGYSIIGFGNIYAEVDLVKGLTLRSSIGGGLSAYNGRNYGRPSYENSENGSDFITYGEQYSAGAQWNFTNTARYQNKFDKHAVDVLVGMEALNTGTGRFIAGNGQRPFSPDLDYITLTTTSNRTVNSGNDPGVNLYSVFAKAQYTFNDKYMIAGTVRRDGASVFGSNNRFGVFPAVSAAWRISEESFMQNMSFVSDLKIRGGWGQMGNQNNVRPENSFNLFASDLGLAYYDISGGNGSPTEGFYRNRIGNPNAKWETSTTTNIGIDGTFMNGKLELVFDVWRKDTKDLLYSLETPAVIGPLAGDPAINIAKMRNGGVDVQVINKGNITGDIKYEVNVTGSFLNNEIIGIAPGVDYFEAGGSRHGNIIRNRVGQSISSYFGYEVIGLFQDQAEVDAAPSQDGKGIGRFRYADINGDGEITPDDRTTLGSPVPKFTGGVNPKFTYKGFELEAFMYLSLGMQNYNFSKWFTDFYPSFTGAAYGRSVFNSFTFENGGNSVPIFENVSNISTNNAPNSYYVEKGNYARLSFITLAYNLPASLISRVGMAKAKVYLQATNLFTISNYSGLDPGVGGGADTTLGIDLGNPPATRGYNIGVSLGF